MFLREIVTYNVYTVRIRLQTRMRMDRFGRQSRDLLNLLIQSYMSESDEAKRLKVSAAPLLHTIYINICRTISLGTIM